MHKADYVLYPRKMKSNDAGCRSLLRSTLRVLGSHLLLFMAIQPRLGE